MKNKIQITVEVTVEKTKNISNNEFKYNRLPAAKARFKKKIIRTIFKSAENYLHIAAISFPTRKTIARSARRVRKGYVTKKNSTL